MVSNFTLRMWYPDQRRHKEKHVINLTNEDRFLFQKRIKLGMVARVFTPHTWESETKDLCEFKASLIYMASSWTAREYIEQ